MTEIQLRSGSSSSATHRLTQTSHALDRHSVDRPTNLAIEEAARRTNDHTTPRNASSAPSRLVNLRVHAADLAKVTAAPALPAETTALAIAQAHAADTPAAAPVDLTSFVPAEADDIETYSPTIARETIPDPIDYPEAIQQETNVSYGLVQYTPSTPAPEVDTETLSMSIAADYAAANLSATATPTTAPIANESIDAIAKAASEAIATIRTASDPTEVAEQIASLQAFADNIKATSAAPEMLELSNTIEKFIGVAMKSSKIQEEVEKKAAAKRREAAKSTPKPSVKTTVKPAARRTTPATTTRRATPHTATARPAAKPITRTVKPTAKKPAPKLTSKRSAKTVARPQLADEETQALKKALKTVVASDEPTATQSKFRRSASLKKKSSGKRFALAFFCAVACVAGVVYFVGANLPDISVKVAAMQTGIEASYPAYVPRDYSLSDISSEEGKITLVFKGPNDASFTLSEEKSSWDSTALLRNFVEPTWRDNYTTTHEQGITLYISGSNAAWVNGGVLYKITTTSNSLTKKQLRNIVTSL